MLHFPFNYLIILQIVFLYFYVRKHTLSWLFIHIKDVFILLHPIIVQTVFVLEMSQMLYYKVEANRIKVYRRNLHLVYQFEIKIFWQNYGNIKIIWILFFVFFFVISTHYVCLRTCDNVSVALSKISQCIP